MVWHVPAHRGEDGCGRRHGVGLVGAKSESPLAPNRQPPLGLDRVGGGAGAKNTGSKSTCGPRRAQTGIWSGGFWLKAPTARSGAIRQACPLTSQSAWSRLVPTESSCAPRPSPVRIVLFSASATGMEEARPRTFLSWSGEAISVADLSQRFDRSEPSGVTCGADGAWPSKDPT